jgi:DNA-binding beta-propeller fold protein YncE
LTRRLAAAFLAAAATIVAACGGPAVESIGRPGTGDGEFRDPRGIAVSDDGLAVLDRTGRMQVLSLDGRFVRACTVVPGDVRRGLPTGAMWLADGSIAVAHTHQSRVVVLGPGGETLRSFGEYGVEPGRFLYPQRITTDAAGDWIVSEYGFERTNRVQVFHPDGTLVRVVGSGAEADGHLGRPMGAVALPDGRLIVADLVAGLVAYERDGRCAGPFGPRPAQDSLYRGICRGDDGDLYVIDGGRNELLRLAPDGALRGRFGAFGDPPEGFREPWDVAWHGGRVYVADMGNHRVARIDPEAVSWRRP